MAQADDLIGAHSRERGAPAAADAVAFAGAIGIAVGVLLLAIEANSNGHGRVAGIAMNAVLIVAGYFALGLLPRPTHGAAVTLIVVGVPGALGWWILPNANSFSDVRPFLILTIAVWAACWFIPRTSGRTIFVAAALIVLWLWILGEVAGTDAYSAAPVPSPPAHTMFSLSALHSEVTIDDLDSTSFLYPVARECDEGDASRCDLLYRTAPPGSDFQEFADACGGSEPAGSGGECVSLQGGSPDITFPDTGSPPVGNELLPGTGSIGAGSSDKSLQLGLVSLVFGIAYVGALAILDRRRWYTLGTAFVIPGFLALFTGTELLGNAADHAWVGGLLTFVAGVAVALIGDLGARRFTTWAGGVFAALGAYTFAVDVTNLRFVSFDSEEVKLVKPGLIAIAAGILLVGLAWVIALLRSRYFGTGGSAPTPVPPPPIPAAPTVAPPTDPLGFGAWQRPSPSAPPTPWESPAPPPTPPPAPPSPPPPPASPPWQPPPAPGTPS